jgi:hypothetical protein
MAEVTNGGNDSSGSLAIEQFLNRQITKRSCVVEFISSFPKAECVQTLRIWLRNFRRPLRRNINLTTVTEYTYTSAVTRNVF